MNVLLAFYENAIDIQYILQNIILYIYLVLQEQKINTIKTYKSNIAIAIEAVYFKTECVMGSGEEYA